MLTCNVSNVSSILFNHTSSHDSHTEVHQPASISNSTTSHHTSPGHHLYEGDLVSKTSNLNEFSISSNWDLGLGFSGGGRKKKKHGCQSHEQFFLFFSSPPLSEKEPGRAIIHHQVITSMREIWSPRPPISMSSQSPSNWGLGPGLLRGGGEKKKVAQSHEQFLFFRPPPLSRGGARQAQLLEIEDSLRLEVLETRSPS